MNPTPTDRFPPPSLHFSRLVRRCAREVNAGAQPFRDLRLACADGAITWNCLFLAPLMSRQLRRECAEAASGVRGANAGGGGGVVTVLLAGFSVRSARSMLELATTGRTAEDLSGGDLEEVRGMLAAMGADEAMFSGMPDRVQSRTGEV